MIKTLFFTTRLHVISFHLLLKTNMKIRPKDSYSKITNIPPYSIWVENDTKLDSGDSRIFGPVSKKLVLGQADYIIWPPSRWGKIDRKRPAVGRAWWA
jgi:hypothetical protein